MTVSASSFGAWAIGGSWGAVDDSESMRALHAAIDAGVNFIDTADVYGDGHSERLVAQLRRERRGETIYVATKAGRRLPVQTPDGYTRENLTAWVDRSLENLEVDAPRSPAAPLPASRRLRSPGGVRHPRRPRDGRQAAPLRRERRDRGRGDEGDSLPERAERADHLQHVPAQTRRRVLRGGEGARRSASSRACRSRAACSPAS